MWGGGLWYRFPFLFLGVVVVVVVVVGLVGARQMYGNESTQHIATPCDNLLQHGGMPQWWGTSQSAHDAWGWGSWVGTRWSRISWLFFNNAFFCPFELFLV